ncbi:MAG: hypothetical protein HKM02_12070, partial [Pseudomonadales bacterium]|nr:hypothetical protein [Pseudomonadales bacterium]
LLLLLLLLLPLLLLRPLLQLLQLTLLLLLHPSNRYLITAKGHFGALFLFLPKMIFNSH